TEYLRLHWKEFRKPVNINDDLILRPLYDGALYLDGHHKGKLKHDFGVEPWTFEQRLGEAVSRLHWKEFRKPVNINDDLLLRPLYDGALYLDGHHKGKLK
ncbi:hypothetical protein KFY57_28175, partial [Salmonella enterica subsp. enterica serovar Typhimurium]|nr:hypothetical protein [Salmonella enterica subsp. enterica serovar Typhimurium]